MKRTDRYVKIRYIIYFSGLLLFMVMYFYVIHKDLKEDLSSYLEKGELLIDYTMDEPYAYTLVSKQGPDGYGDFLRYFEKKNKGWQRIYEKDFKNLCPGRLKLLILTGTT
jgi:hypothetical protein